MTRRGILLGVIGGLTASLLGGCGQLFPERYRFRMIVEVDTPEGLRRGSSVYQVTAYNTGEFLPEAAKRNWYVKGEAVAVDLPGGQTLFALMKPKARWDSLAQVSMGALDPAFNNDIVQSAARISEGRNARSMGLVKPEDYPVLVRFRNIRDPNSVEEVDPKNLAKSFGQGVRLKSVTIQITQDPVKWVIRDRLPAPPKNGFFNWDGRSNPNESGIFGIGDFIRDA